MKGVHIRREARSIIASVACIACGALIFNSYSEGRSKNIALQLESRILVNLPDGTRLLYRNYACEDALLGECINAVIRGKGGKDETGENSVVSESEEKIQCVLLFGGNRFAAVSLASETTKADYIVTMGLPKLGIANVVSR